MFFVITKESIPVTKGLSVVLAATVQVIVDHCPLPTSLIPRPWTSLLQTIVSSSATCLTAMSPSRPLLFSPDTRSTSTWWCLWRNRSGTRWCLRPWCPLTRCVPPLLLACRPWIRCRSWTLCSSRLLCWWVIHLCLWMKKAATSCVNWTRVTDRLLGEITWRDINYSLTFTRGTAH